ncbi:ATP-binding protein [Dyadobacter fermentans]|uniref:ATP-binding protein n=1 Tax=Dyadobacter fermentans TaxID=94254 RepID=UPI001C9DA416|nr:ATP-binding protein [Dyadobacter fermentans]
MEKTFVRITKLVFCVSCLLILHPSQTCFAQRPVYSNEQHFGVDDGLPQSFITGFTQNKDGFIWISTLDGLSRFDGRGFKNFRNRPGDPATIAQNVIFKIIPHADSSKLTLIYEGLHHDCFDTRTFRAKRIPHLATLRRIPGTKAHFINRANVYNGEDWVFARSVAGGIGWVNAETGKTFFANTANGLLKQDTLSVIFQSADGGVFLISEDGVQVSDKAKKHFKFIRFNTSVDRLRPEMIFDGNINAGTVARLPGNRLLVYRDNRVVLLDLVKRTSKSITIPGGVPAYNNSHKDLLCQDSKGLVYLVNQGRVFRVNEKDQLELIWQSGSAPQFNVTAFFVDRSDVLWMSINTHGITKIDLRAIPFYTRPYKSGFVADILEEAGIPPPQIPAEWTDSAIDYYFRQAWASDNQLYLTANLWGNGEIFSYDGATLSRFNRARHSKVYTALVVKPGGEVCAFEQMNSRWYSWKAPASAPDSFSLNRAEMMKVEMTDGYFAKGSLWLATYASGLLQYKDAQRIGHFIGKQPGSRGHMPNELTEICSDPLNKNLLWIGSRGFGLILWDVEKGLQQIFTVDDGLPNNTVYCILPDRAGKLWCSTNKGIFRLDPKTKEIHSFDKSDGLQGNEFNRAHKFRFFDGRLAFGGTEGYTIFDPAAFDGNHPRTRMPIQLISLQINNELQQPSLRGSIVAEPLSLIREITLPFDKNHLRFEFAALRFNQPAKTKYRFQMVGIDKQWVENGTSNVASYLGLSPGKYKLLVNATDNMGLWGKDFKEISIVIRPPFWATMWAYLIYALVLVVIVWRYLVFKEERMITRQKLAFEKREALRLKEMDELKDRFFSNITHEFRTPLTLIISPLQKLLSEGAVSGPIRQTLRGIEKNSRQLLGLVNEFLDFSKLNDGQMQVNRSAGELAPFVSAHVRSFEAAASEKQITLSFASGDVEGFYLFDQEKWSKIVINLLGNALKFTPEKGAISVGLRQASGDCIVLEVWDNGPGIATDQQERIFERFYQVDGSAIRSQGGTGIGLALVKEMVGVMGGHIQVDSEPGKYARFCVELPVPKALSPENTTLNSDTPLFRPVPMDGALPQLFVVEDNDELRAFIMTSLEGAYRVTGAANGMLAWEMIRTSLPDIVISDVMMPGRDGFDLCKLCKSDPLTAHIGFILLTSKAAHQARIHGLEAGADVYLTKPFQMDELELRVLNLCRLQQNVRAQLKARLFSQPPEAGPGITDPFLNRLYQEIDARLANPDLMVDDLCKALSVSKSTLNRKLKALLDASAADLIRQYRLEKATTLLRSGMDIASVSYNVGFGSPSYFTQCFRERYHLTPSDFISGGI